MGGTAGCPPRRRCPSGLPPLRGEGGPQGRMRGRIVYQHRSADRTGGGRRPPLRIGWDREPDQSRYLLSPNASLPRSQPPWNRRLGILLDKLQKISYNPVQYDTAMTGRSTAPVPLREPPDGARGRGQAGKYALEQPPERGRPPVGPRRVRPLPRRGVMALHEAVFVRKR